jgi:hypothetical protein
MKNKNQELEEKFSKFSGEPAGEKIYDRKGFFSQVEENRNLKMEQIASMRGIKK